MDNRSGALAGTLAILDELRRNVEQAESDKATAFQEGRAALAQELLHWAQAVLSGSPSVQSTSAHVAEKPRKRGKPLVARAANGIAAQAIASVFKEASGLGVSEIHQRATTLGHTLSVEGVGNELRRFVGSKYLRDGRKWYPKTDDQTFATGLASGASDTPDAQHDQAA